MTISRKNFLVVWGILLSAGLIWSVAYWHYLPHLPDTYAGEAIHGRVVDAETGEPIAGAIVIGLYELSAPYSMEGGIIAGHMHVEEVLTDVDGHYYLSAWGPKPRPGKAYLQDDSPRILVYREGYRYFLARNASMTGDARYRAVQQTYWTGRDIGLERFKGDLNDAIKHMWGMSMIIESLLNPYFGARDCPWKQVPRIMLAFDRFNQELAANNIRTGLLPNLDSLVIEGNCGTREDFIREYENENMDDTGDSNTD